MGEPTDDGTTQDEDKSFFEDGFGRWTAALPAEMQKDERLKGMKGPGEAVSKWFEHEKTVSELNEKVKSLTPDVPGSPDGYDVGTPELPAGMSVDEEIKGQFLKTCHENKIPKNAAKAIYNMYHKVLVDAFNKRAEKLKEAMDGVKNEWGESFDGNKELARRAIVKFGGEELAKAIDGEDLLSNNPHVLKAFYEIGKAVGEDSFTGGKPRGPANDLTWDDLYPSMKDIPDRQD